MSRPDLLFPLLTPTQSTDSAIDAPARAPVIVVHGLWMNGAVFALQRAQLARRGHRASAFSYSSTRMGLDDIASRLQQTVRALQAPAVDIVAHSLGGLAVLNMLTLYPDVPVGRVVLLGTPCTSSRTVQQLAAWKAGRTLIGKALLQWQPERGLAAVRAFEVGMIAGTVPLGLGRLVARLPAPHDGAVCVDETRMAGLRDHLTMPVSHSGMLVSARVTRQICSFLEQGHFTPA
jgi:pimeloyl-ACP methyl ester carboxylesterase